MDPQAQEHPKDRAVLRDPGFPPGRPVPRYPAVQQDRSRRLDRLDREVLKAPAHPTLQEDPADSSRPTRLLGDKRVVPPS